MRPGPVAAGRARVARRSARRSGRPAGGPGRTLRADGVELGQDAARVGVEGEAVRDGGSRRGAQPRRVVWAGQHEVERLDPALRRPVDEAGGAVLDVLVHGERPGHHGRAAEVHGHQEGEDAGAALGPCAPGRPPHGHRAATARTRRTRPVAPRRCRAGPTVQRLRDEQEGQARTPTGCLEQRAVIAEGVTAGHDPIAQRGDRIVRGPARARRGRSRRAGRASCCRRPARTGAAAGPRPGQDEVPVDGPIGEPYDEALEPGRGPLAGCHISPTGRPAVARDFGSNPSTTQPSGLGWRDPRELYSTSSAPRAAAARMRRSRRSCRLTVAGSPARRSGRTRRANCSWCRSRLDAMSGPSSVLTRTFVPNGAPPGRRAVRRPTTGG